MAADAGQELELKLELDDAGLEALRSSGTLEAMRAAPPKTARLHGIYYDTRDHRLGAADMGLRVREEDGRWVQTLKIGANVRLGLSNPLEAEWAVERPRPDLDKVVEEPFRDALVRALGTRDLRRQFETVMVREKSLVRPTSGGLVEVAVDHGQVHAETGEAIVREVEIELKEGAPTALLVAAEALFADIPFRLGVETKAERGYRLLAGRPARTLGSGADAFGAVPALSPAMPARDAFAAIGAAYAGAACAHADRIRDGVDPEGPHQLRVFLRRLRTLLRAFRPAFDGPRLRRIADDARALARTAGELRDADVLVTEIVPEGAAGAGDVPADALAALAARLEDDRQATRARVRDDLAGPRWSWLTLQLALFPLVVERAEATGEGPGADRPLGEVAVKALKRAYKKVDRWGRRIEKLSVEERHEMRKALKGLRYTIEMFAPLWSTADVAAYVKQLKRMQDVFGYLNDVETARGWLSATAGGTAGAPALDFAGAGFEVAPASPTARAAAEIVDWHGKRADEAWEKARKRWKRFNATPRFWEEIAPTP